MKIDINYPSATANSANQQQRVRSSLRQILPPDESNTGEVRQDGATARVPATVRVPPTAGISRTAQVSDTADVSGIRPSISTLATVVHSSADVRQAKVAALRDAVAQGTYQVSPQRIADSMLAQATSKLR